MKTFLQTFTAPFTKNKKKRAINMQKNRFDIAMQLTWITPALVFVALFTIYAIYIVFRDGFNARAATNNFVGSVINFKVLVHDISFGRSILNSFLYVAISLPVSLLISLGVAKFLSNIKNRKVFSVLQSLFFLPYVTSAIAIAMAFSMIFSNDSNSLFAQLVKACGGKAIDWTNPVNAIALLLVYGIWMMLPFQIIMFTSAFMSVDKRLYQAASIDGMSKWKQFWSVSIPQIMPIIIYMVTTNIIGAFKFMPLGLFPSYANAQASGAQTVVYYIFNNITATHNYGKAGAASIILMAIILTMSIANAFLTKFLKKKYR